MSSSHSQKRTLTTIFSSCALFISSEHCTSTSFADCPSARSALPMPVRQSVSLTVATATQLSSSSRQANSSFTTESSWDVCGDFLRGNRGRKSEGEGEGKEREREEREERGREGERERRREGEGERGRERGQEREGERGREREREGKGKDEVKQLTRSLGSKKEPPQKTQTSDTYRCRPRGASSGRFLLLWRHFRAKKIAASFQYGRPGFYRVVGYE